MNIKKVELVTHFDKPEKGGERIPVVTPHFLVTTDDSELPLAVPFDPLNMDYVAVREWHESQKKKSLKFDFKNAKPE